MRARLNQRSANQRKTPEADRESMEGTQADPRGRALRNRHQRMRGRRRLSRTLTAGTSESSRARRRRNGQDRSNREPKPVAPP